MREKLLENHVGARRAVQSADGALHRERRLSIDRLDIEFELLTAIALDFDFHNRSLGRRESRDALCVNQSCCGENGRWV